MGTCRLYIFAALLLLTQTACTSGNPGGISNAAQPSSSLEPLANQPDAVAGKFSLWVDTDSFIGSGSAGFWLRVNEADNATTVEVHAENAAGLKALYFRLGYDTAAMHPAEAKATGVLAGADSASESGCLIELPILGLSDGVYHGQVLTGWEDKDGFSGSGCLAQVVFEPGALTETRKISVTPTSSQWQQDLAYHYNDNTLYWRYFSSGDMNQDGEVNLSDMTPLGQYFGQKISSGYPEHGILYVVDSDDNGTITLGDMVPIARDFHQKVDGFALYGSTNPESDTPGSPSEAPKLASLMDASLDDAIGDKSQERLRFEVNLPAFSDTTTYWIRPYDADGHGIMSDSLEIFPGLLESFSYEILPETYMDGATLDGLSFDLVEQGTEGGSGDASLDCLITAINAASLDKFSGYTYFPGTDISQDNSYSKLLVSNAFPIGNLLTIQQGRFYSGFIVSSDEEYPSGNADMYLAKFNHVDLPEAQPTVYVPLDDDWHTEFIVGTNNETGFLEWAYPRFFDGSQNGYVEEDDLFWVGYYFAETSSSPDYYTGKACLADLDQNGEINIADIIGLGLLQGYALDGFNIYITDDPLLVPDENGDWCALTPAGWVGREDGAGDFLTERLSYSFNVSAGLETKYAWLGVTYEGEVGMASNVVEIPAEIE